MNELPEPKVWALMVKGSTVSVGEDKVPFPSFPIPANPSVPELARVQAVPPDELHAGCGRIGRRSVGSAREVGLSSVFPGRGARRNTAGQALGGTLRDFEVATGRLSVMAARRAWRNGGYPAI
ncbi:hypothetical protein [Paenibacillus caui]|uniref:hypothetical protein n=1 Tax=Paenibacillus caui TaxID=2873927 RepID=UPI001CA95113|nr:hypothetical protein [Paenibacillus caui]